MAKNKIPDLLEERERDRFQTYSKSISDNLKAVQRKILILCSILFYYFLYHNNFYIFPMLKSYSIIDCYDFRNIECFIEIVKKCIEQRRWSNITEDSIVDIILN